MLNSKGGIFCSFAAALGSESLSEYEDFKELLRERLGSSLTWLSSSHENGLGWFDLPEASVTEVEHIASWLAGYDAIVHVGIGGSALANLMLHQALASYYHNEKNTKSGPLFYLADNPDPDKASAIWQEVSRKKCALIGVSKSGATVETMALFLWFRDQMQKQNNGEAVDEHLLVVTDPNQGVFRSFAEQSGCKVLSIPPSVGGRYSALASGGLVTAAALGVNIRELLEGALDMKERILSESDPNTNSALHLALLQIFHEKKKRPISVWMPYSSRLERFAEWYAQLWAESIGKNGRGTTPVRALGAVDQHSQVQLYVEGPDDKFYTLIRVRNFQQDLALPHIKDASLNDLSYLEGQFIGEMLGYEAKSTAAALARIKRPLFWLEMERITPYSIGQLIFFYECVTALTGYLMNINPFDQPGVEQGKKYAFGLMGREGYEDAAADVNSIFDKISRGIRCIG